MEPRPASPCAEHTLRQGLLISALLLTIWNTLTTAQLTIESVPHHAVEGKNLLLQVHNLPDRLQGYLWFKGEISISNEIVRFVINSNTNIPRPAHTGRETIHHNGSLLVENVSKNDTGVYILQTFSTDLVVEEASVEIHVYQQVTKPSIQTINTTTTKQDSMVMTCLSDDPGLSIRWLFNGQSLQLTARIMVSQNNSRLSIDSVRREDAGEYQCEISNPASSSKSDVLSVVVIAEQNPLQGLPVWTVVITVTGVLVLILATALGCFLFLTKTSRARVQHHLRKPRTAVSASRPGASNSYAFAPVSSHREDTPVYQELVHPDINIYDRINYTANMTS